MRYQWRVASIGATLAWLVSSAPLFAQGSLNPDAAKVANPIPPTPESLSAGRQVYQRLCRACHHASGNGQGPFGIAKSIHPSDFTDETWEYGSTDGEIFEVIKNGIRPERVEAGLHVQKGGGPSLDHAYDGRISPTDMWNVVNYIRTFAKPHPQN